MISVFLFEFLKKEKNTEQTFLTNQLKKLITYHLFLAKQNIVFRGHDESKGSLNKGNFLELLELRKEYVPIFTEL